MTEIFANHAHLFPAEARPEGSPDALARLLDECGIARVVCFAPFHAHVPALDPNAWLAETLRGRPGWTGFGVVDFKRDDVAAQVDRAADLGLKGLKLHPAFQGFRVDGPRACEAYARAEARGLFVSFHTGVHWHRIRDYEMLLFDEVAHHSPNLRFSLEHVGGYSFFPEAVAVLVNNMRGGRANVYAGLTSVFDPVVNKHWHLSDERIRDLMHMVGPEQCIFGLDFPYNDAAKTRDALRCIDAWTLPDEAKAGILGGNLARLLDGAP